MKFDVQHSTKSPDLPFDIIALIIDTVGEYNDTNLLKELALVSYSFLQICTKHLFATVDLHDAFPEHHVASSKKGFVKLLKSRPDVVKYIRNLTYKVTPRSKLYPTSDNDDDLLLPILPNFLRTISRLNYLKINASRLHWDEINSSLTSALLHLMHLPTINHIDLSSIKNFPLSSLTASVNLRRLDIFYLTHFDPDGDDSFGTVQSETMPNIREFHISESDLVTTKLLRAKRQDGRSAFNFMDLRRLSISSIWFEDEWDIRYLLQNAKLLENLHLSLAGLSIRPSRILVGFQDIISLCARTLKVLELTVAYDMWCYVFIEALCKEMEAMAEYNMLETLSLEVHVRGFEIEDFIGSIIRKVDMVLVKAGWSALRQVSFKFLFDCWSREVSRENIAKVSERLQYVPDKYLNLSKFEIVVINSTTFVVKCKF